MPCIADVSTFSNDDFKSVKSEASEICHIFRTKTDRALLLVGSDRFNGLQVNGGGV